MSQEKLVIYHNPKCSKSRETLQLLEENNMSPKIIEYLEEPPTPDELTHILALLGIGARELLRTTEQLYKDAELDDDSLSDAEIIETICEYPILMQRPIVVQGKQAIIGRPPVKVLDLIA